MTEEQRARKLERLPRSPDDDYTPEAVAQRLELARRAAEIPLEHVAGKPVPPASARGNIENLIGFAQVPIGLAGPLRADVGDGELEVYVPMATTEGALVASYSRGMSVLREAGTLRARVVADGLSQHPMLVYDRLESAQRALASAATLLPRFHEIVAGITRHGSLQSVEPELFGRRLVLRLVFGTGDAIGINMAARAADLCSRELGRLTDAEAVFVHGQDVEKRANARALVEGRGRSVIADATVPRELLARRLRVTPEALVEIGASYAIGFAGLGTTNWGIQTANGLAAIMIACGQDAAYLAECASGHLELALTGGGDLYAALHLPSLLVGTVGGGSGQGTAKECLGILGCAGDGRARRFAELIAAALLAGDLSLMAAFQAGEFVAAHERLGRNRPPGAGGRGR